MEIKSKEIKLIDIEKIVENPKNANRHPVEQIERLEKMIKKVGFRQPLIISNRTGFLVAGHGRLEVAKNLGMKEVPVVYQDFESEAEEYAFLIGDNEISRWTELDMQSVYENLKEFPELDVELLGIENFKIELDFNIDEELRENGINGTGASGVRKAIMIEFEIEDYEEGLEVIKWWRDKGMYIGKQITKHLKDLRENENN